MRRDTVGSCEILVWHHGVEGEGVSQSRERERGRGREMGRERDREELEKLSSYRPHHHQRLCGVQNLRVVPAHVTEHLGPGPHPVRVPASSLSLFLPSLPLSPLRASLGLLLAPPVLPVQRHEAALAVPPPTAKSTNQIYCVK